MDKWHEFPVAINAVKYVAEVNILDLQMQYDSWCVFIHSFAFLHQYIMGSWWGSWNCGVEYGMQHVNKFDVIKYNFKTIDV